jgi:hypothetical protein
MKYPAIHRKLQHYSTHWGTLKKKTILIVHAPHKKEKLFRLLGPVDNPHKIDRRWSSENSQE